MNPYEVLGVNPNAGWDEIRAAYLEKVKKYHPDRYADSPLKEQANEKLSQVNQAYDMLEKMHKQGQGTANGASAGGQWGGDAYARVRAALDAGNVASAFMILNAMPMRDAQWHYWMGVVQMRRGAYDTARNHFATAVQMEPNNGEYQRAYQSVAAYGRGRYRKTYNMDMDSAGKLRGICTACCFLSTISQCCCRGESSFPCCFYC